MAGIFLLSGLQYITIHNYQGSVAGSGRPVESFIFLVVSREVTITKSVQMCKYVAAWAQHALDVIALIHGKTIVFEPYRVQKQVNLLLKPRVSDIMQGRERRELDQMCVLIQLQSIAGPGSPLIESEILNAIALFQPAT